MLCANIQKKEIKTFLTSFTSPKHKIFRDKNLTNLLDFYLWTLKIVKYLNKL